MLSRPGGVTVYRGPRGKGPSGGAEVFFLDFVVRSPELPSATQSATVHSLRPPLLGSIARYVATIDIEASVSSC